ncbi:MAG: hypothetical protein ACXVB1_07305 [Pseudobdellovibrionaceae bacterium]
MKPMSLIIAAGILLTRSLSFGLDVEEIFGHEDQKFIHAYNERLFQWFFTREKSLQKCFSEREKEQLVSVLNFWPSWGERYGTFNLLLNFEIFYEQNGKGSPITPGLRLRLPPMGSPALGEYKGDQGVWGVEVKMDPLQSCHWQKIRKGQQAGTETLEVNAEEKMRLRPEEGSKMPYPFSRMVKSSFPIFTGPKLTGEILFLGSYNLLFFNRAFFPIALAHEKEFHQLALRMKWKSENEYSVYYP